MKDIIQISNSLKDISGTIELPGSKSESNRAIIINALSGNNCNLLNLSTSSDTMILLKAMASDKTEINAGDAGTAMRFLIAYFAAIGKSKILTGSDRMHERPVGPLVDGLNKIGSHITYEDKKGFPPVNIHASTSAIHGNRVKIVADISSQFISALMMIAPTLPWGLEIEMERNVASKPYIEMTQGLMQHFGIVSQWVENVISIKKQNYIAADYTIEGDWSCASYWYAIAASVNNAAIFLKGLKRQSLQGDAILQDWFKPFGVVTEFSDTGVFITKEEADFSKIPKIIDFADHPDLAQTMIVLCAAKGLKCKFTGIESLRIKETDRIAALKRELEKFDVKLVNETDVLYKLEGNFNHIATPVIEKYNDHRMVMAFAILAFYCKQVKISNPECVKKSYPGFWKDLELMGCKFE